MSRKKHVIKLKIKTIKLEVWDCGIKEHSHKRHETAKNCLIKQCLPPVIKLKHINDLDDKAKLKIGESVCKDGPIRIVMDEYRISKETAFKCARHLLFTLGYSHKDYMELFYVAGIGQHKTCRRLYERHILEN